MKNSPVNLVTFKLDKSIRDKASKMKKIHKYKTYDLLFTDILDFFLDNELSPKDTSKPIHKLVADVRETFVTFHRTFETKKLMPILLELKQQYLNTNLTLQEFINYSAKYNDHLLDVLDNLPQERKKLHSNILDNKEENVPNDSFLDSNFKSNNMDELKIIFDEFEKQKLGKFSEGKNIYQYDVMTYNIYMDKIKLILNRK